MSSTRAAPLPRTSRCAICGLWFTEHGWRGHYDACSRSAHNEQWAICGCGQFYVMRGAVRCQPCLQAATLKPEPGPRQTELVTHELANMAECPWCDKKVNPADLMNHVRMAHFDDPRAFNGAKKGAKASVAGHTLSDVEAGIELLERRGRRALTLLGKQDPNPRGFIDGHCYECGGVGCQACTPNPENRNGCSTIFNTPARALAHFFSMYDPEHTRNALAGALERLASPERVLLVRQVVLELEHPERANMLSGLHVEDLEEFRALCTLALRLRAEALEEEYTAHPWTGQVGEFRCRRCGHIVLSTAEKDAHRCAKRQLVPDEQREAELRDMLKGLTDREHAWLIERLAEDRYELTDFEPEREHLKRISAEEAEEVAP